MKNVAILGATGSIGASTLSVLRRHPDRFRLVAVTAHSQVDRLADICLEMSPCYAALTDPNAATLLEARLRTAGCSTRVLGGTGALSDIARLPEADTIVAAIVGAAGLESSLAAVIAGKRVLLANKESLVMAGDLFMRAVERSAAVLLPIDSEHNAIHQALPQNFRGDLAVAGVRRILLTASGGPFRLTPLAELATVTPEQACAHPNWVMGRKISVDSATMMNKGLEVIEAKWLFNARPEQIEVVVHPQSTVHSLVEYVDGSLLAQLGQPDMRTPIAYALAYPDRIDAGVETLDLLRCGRLDFHPPDFSRFPCLGLAYAALERGGTAPAQLSAANEVAVGAFLDRVIAFPEIAHLIEDVMARISSSPAQSIDDVFEADRAAREAAHSWIAGRRDRGLAVPLSDGPGERTVTSRRANKAAP